MGGIELHLQAGPRPADRHRVSRAQFQYTLEDADPERACHMVLAHADENAKASRAGRRRHDQQTSGLRVALTIDRDTASRLGMSPQAIDDTLYDAFGQRQVSTISPN